MSNEAPENPFASPAAVSSIEYREFHVSDHEVASKESFQLIIAGALALIFGLIWLNAAVQPGMGTISTPFLIGHGLLGFMTISCVATVINHTVRWRRAWKRFPMQLNDEGLRAKFQQDNQWIGYAFAWHEIRKVTFVPRNRMMVETIDGKQWFADLSLMSGRKWHPLKETLKYYSDAMAIT
ncbi:hypothetical protein ACYFX5_21080 [Bremerella sp. T1]|uniref:hypothetical protein n=1 Tax=Bremerella sp. TYQ1 TaxID=3119568 RepID=UPI001CCBDDE3|nr:hypothetical protein [Bremerella volcania]UBM35537.1 hypothetical protein LA756_23020 [Bremerella volcania]